MRRRAAARGLLLAVLLGAADARAAAAQEGEGGTIGIEPDAPLSAAGRPAPSAGRGGARLASVLAGLEGPARIELAPGAYYLSATPFEDPSCGNCDDPRERVPATVGLHIRGSRIEIAGAHRDSVVIHTGAGYGILFEDCRGCALRAVTVTGGVRDPDARATDAAVVVRRSGVTLEACALRDNIGDPATVRGTTVGIMGIAGREESLLSVRDCRITRNSWDGIALYRGARAEIRDNVIDGVDRATGERVGGGRGVGIGLTWDARAVVSGNLVTRYWKGIGIFLDADGAVLDNVVEDVATWGIALWDAERGSPRGIIQRNAVFRTGACGASLSDPGEVRGGPGLFVGNAIVRSGQDARYDSGEPYCPQRALARTAVPPAFVVEDNLLFDNREADGAPGAEDVGREEFLRRLAPLLAALRSVPATAGSRFVAEFSGEE